jgi:hypothetical protein
MHVLHSHLGELMDEGNEVIEFRPVIVEAFWVAVHVFNKRIEKRAANKHLKNQMRNSLPFFIIVVFPVLELKCHFCLNNLSLKYFNLISEECVNLSLNVTLISQKVCLNRKRIFFNGTWILFNTFYSFLELFI